MIWKVALALYLFIGLMIGLTLAWAVPATNIFGVIYLTLIWPVWVSQELTGIHPPVPMWMFTFDT